MNSETDVLEFDFPEYEEPYPPFPDVKIVPFDKENSYSRNRDIADKLYADRQKEDDRRREELRRAELEKMERLNPAALQPKSKAAKIVPIAAAVFAITAMVATSLTSGGMIKPDGVTTENTAAEETFEPFEKEDGTVVYNTGSLCYKISVLEKTADKLTFYIDVRNLSENNYTIKNGNFYISDGTKKIYDQNPVINYGVYYYESAHFAVRFGKGRSFDCKYIGYYEESPSESFIMKDPDNFEVSIEELL